MLRSYWTWVCGIFQNYLPFEEMSPILNQGYTKITLPCPERLDPVWKVVLDNEMDFLYALEMSRKRHSVCEELWEFFYVMADKWGNRYHYNYCPDYEDMVSFVTILMAEKTFHFDANKGQYFRYFAQVCAYGYRRYTQGELKQDDIKDDLREAVKTIYTDHYYDPTF